MLLPVLRRSDWPGLAAGMAARPWAGTADAPSLMVAYAEHRDGRLDFIAEADDAVHTQALTNLERIPSTFEVIETGGDRVLISVGSPVVSDRLMLTSHMVGAHNLLRADELVVSVARQGSVVVADLNGSPAVRQALLDAHQQSMAEADTESPSGASQRLLDDLLIIRKGEPDGILPVDQL